MAVAEEHAAAPVDEMGNRPSCVKRAPPSLCLLHRKAVQVLMLAFLTLGTARTPLYLGRVRETGHEKV